MRFKRIIKKGILFLDYLLKFKSAKVAYLFSFYNINKIEAQGLDVKNGFVQVASNGNKVAIAHLPTFGFSTSMLIGLLKSNAIKTTQTHSNFFIANYGELQFKVQSLSNMAVMYEIFIEDIYSFETAMDNIIVVDIGMNVGVAAMHFASKACVSHVYGYEPFPKTYEEACDNMALNANIANKITLFNMGVSDVSEFRKIYLFESGLLSASTTTTNNEYGKIKNTHIEVELTSIHRVLDNVLNNHINAPILLKIDCEGEEYAIFEQLSNTHYLDNVICIMLEWHEKGFEQLEAILLKHNFQLFHKHHVSENSGMIYAYKHPK